MGMGVCFQRSKSRFMGPVCRLSNRRRTDYDQPRPVRKGTDFLVIKAIMQGELPASFDHPSISKFVEGVLVQCWSTEPGSRPSMAWCSEHFVWQTVKLFNERYGNHLERVPPDYTTEGDGWRAIRNPAAVKTYEFDFGAKFPEVRCVV